MCGEPWYYRPWEVGKLTPFQVRRVLQHPRDDKGQLLIAPSMESVKHPVEELIEAYQKRGLPHWRAKDLAEEQFSEWQREAAEAVAAYMNRDDEMEIGPEVELVDGRPD